jgi:hypothetical protein
LNNLTAILIKMTVYYFYTYFYNPGKQGTTGMTVSQSLNLITNGQFTTGGGTAETNNEHAGSSKHGELHLDNDIEQGNGNVNANANGDHNQLDADLAAQL